MTHIHIPDWVLPNWLWIAGFLVMTAGLGLSVLRLRGTDTRRKIPLLGALSATMLVAMNLEIVPIAYHINLSVVAGILLGPSLGFIAAFITNLMLALIGHGGLTVMGLNTLLLGSEAVLGHAVFSLLGGRLPIFWRAAAATAATLVITTSLLIGIVAASNMDPLAFMHEHEQAQHETGAERRHIGHPGPETGREHGAGGLSVRRFAILALTLGAIGWLIEAVVTGTVVRFIARVKPDLLRHVLHAEAGGKGRNGT